jgi:acetyl esterase/lipase
MYMENAKTPTLILQGENDTTDPLGQSHQLYRGLKRYGVKADLVEYPRESHGPQEEKHNLDILNWIVHWYDDNLSATGLLFTDSHKVAGVAQCVHLCVSGDGWRQLRRQNEDSPGSWHRRRGILEQLWNSSRMGGSQ